MTSDREWERIRAHARKVADSAPPFTDDQAQRLIALFGPITVNPQTTRPALAHSEVKAA